MSTAAPVGAAARLSRVRSSPDVRWAVGLALLALAIRLAVALIAGRTVVFDPNAKGLPFNDSFFYSWVGGAISVGDGYTFLGEPTLHWPPAYPYALAAVFKVFGTTTKNALVFNAFVGAATVPLAYVAALKTFGRPAAIGAAAALTVFPGQILMGDVILAETFYTFQLVLFVALAAVLDRDRIRSLVVLGLIAGLAALTRGEGVFFPVFILALAAGRGQWRSALRQTVIVTLVMLAAVAPWTVRNAIVADTFVPVSINATSTLAIGHGPEANGGPVAITHVTPPSLKGIRAEVEGARILRKRAIKWAVHHPFQELKLIPLKLRWLIRGDSHVMFVWINASGQRPIPGAAETAVHVLADGAWYALLAALLATVALFWRPIWRNPLARAMLVFVALEIPLYGFIYFGNPRYRITHEPLQLILVAGGVLMFLQRRRDRRAEQTPAPAPATSGGGPSV